MDLIIRADWTAHSQYHIDFARGTITHSRAANRAQTNRLFSEYSTSGIFKYLTYPQATTFYRKNRMAELYLQYLRGLALNEVERIAQQATPFYILNHRRVIERAVNTLDYPVAQNTTVGYVRTSLDRQKLVDYMSKLINESIKFGQVPLSTIDKARRKQDLLNNLRQIAFAKP